MSALVIIIPTSIFAFILYLTLSEKIAGWFAWIVILVNMIYFYFKALELRKRFIGGSYLLEREILAMLTIKIVAPIMIICCIILLFINISKLHLIWFYLLITTIFEMLYAKRLVKEIDKK